MVSAAIPTYLRGPVLIETIDSVLAENPDELIVVDQTPVHDADMRAKIAERQKDPRVRWIQQTYPNLPMARNAALRAAKGEIVVFVDDDVILEPGFFDAHARAHGQGVGAVAGNVLQDNRHSLTEGETEVASAIGCNFSVNREAAIKIHGFDECFEGSAFGEEEDFCRRLRDAGFKIAAAPSAKLLHLKSPSGGCRVNATPMEEWKKAIGWLILNYRYPASLKRRAYLWKNAVLTGPFRRENRKRPLAVLRCLPPFFDSMKRARRAAVRVLPEL